MKCVTYGSDGQPSSLRLIECPQPRPAAGEILIRVHSAGINRPDILQRRGLYVPPPGASTILGLEVAGTIVAVGEDVTEWRVGEPVCALVPGGGYAEYCLAPAGQTLRVPTGLSLTQAATLPEVWFTVWANLVDLAHLSAGERLLVHGGSSGIGLAAIQLGRHLGAEVIVTVGNDEKAEACRQWGATAAINYRREDFAEPALQLSAGEGCDVVLDVVGAPYFARNLRVLRQDGRLILLGFLGGSGGELNLEPIMHKRLRVTGSRMRSRTHEEKTVIRDALAQHIWPAIAAGQIRTHVHATFPLAEVSQAHELMESSRHIGKIALIVTA